MDSPRLKPAILPRPLRRVLETQAKPATNLNFFLAGGSALALRFGHRSSKDLDWFTPERFKPAELEGVLRSLPNKPERIDQNSSQTVRAYYSGDIETSFILYNQVPRQVDLVSVGPAQNFPLARVELLAAMKAAALHDRGTKRDFIDVYAISKQPDWSVARFIQHAARSLPLLADQVARSLVYFKDAEADPMPARCRYSWETVKAHLVAEVRRWEQARDRGR